MKIKLLFLVLLPFSFIDLYSQSSIKGRVIDALTQESLIGVQIQVIETSVITFTDIEGKFSLDAPFSTPLVLEASFFGYDSLRWVVQEDQKEIKIVLNPTKLMEKIPDRLGRRVEAFILDAPDAVKKMDFMDIMMNPLPDFYQGLGNMEGVHVYNASVGLNTINTRGFGTVFNNRITQLVDGVDMSIPGYDVSIGNSIGPSELDVEEASLTAGPGSALYSANAFNGILQIKTKDIAEYPGVSAYVKQGVTLQDNLGSRPFTDLGLRYAFTKGRWGMKFVVSYLDAKEWIANDYGTISENPSQPGTPLDLYNNDRPNVYGDLLLIPLPNGAFINATGYREEDLFEENVDNVKANVVLQYDLNNNLKLVYDGRISRIDYVDRTAYPTPVENELTFLQKLELKGEKFFLRSYYTDILSGRSYNPELVSAQILTNFVKGEVWGNRYFAAWNGNVEGVAPNEPSDARAYADTFVPDATSDQFEVVRNQIINADEIGSAFQNQVNRSSLWHIEGQYDLMPDILPMIQDASLQIGGSFRKYKLKSQGTLFNDRSDGPFADGIGIWKFGAFILVSKAFFDKRMTVYGSLRYDDHQDFESQFSPRLASTLRLDTKGNHYMRLQARYGFRTPVPAEMFALEGGNSLTNPIFLGSISRNLEAMEIDGTSGTEIFQNLVTLESYNDYITTANFDPDVLVPANLALLKQERVRTLEIGYRGLIKNGFFIDVNAYISDYDHFSRSSIVFSPELLSPVIVTSNFEENITGWGAGLNLEYNFPKRYKLQAAYTYSDADISDSDVRSALEDPSQLAIPSYNSPRHLASIGISNRNVYKGLGFSLQYNWWDSYFYNFTIINEQIQATGIVNAAISIKFPDKPLLVKLGASNALNNGYKTVAAGPSIGTQYYVSVAFDNFFW